MRRTMAIPVAVALVAVLAASTGCTRVRLQDSPDTQTYTTSDSVSLQGATKLTADLRQGVGELTLKAAVEPTGAVQVMFTFSPQSWEPKLSSTVEASSAVMHITQPEGPSAPMFGSAKNAWAVKLPKGVSTDLTLQLGVGTSDVDLRGIDLTRLDASTGVGATTIDLTGPRTSDVSARIESGVGKLTLRLPRSVGARVTGGSEGLGEFTADGVSVSSSGWINDAYSGSGPKIDIELHRGVGDVEIVLVD